jgi:hypothetical protein
MINDERVTKIENIKTDSTKILGPTHFSLTIGTERGSSARNSSARKKLECLVFEKNFFLVEIDLFNLT